MEQQSIFGAPGLEAVRVLCASFGYDSERRREEFPVWTGVATLRPDLVCFSHPLRHDMDTAVIVAGVVSGDSARELHWTCAQALGAPVSIFREMDEWELWLLGDFEGDPGSLERVPFDPADTAFARFLSPGELLAAKRQERQLPLFDIDVSILDRARRRIGDSLDERVRESARDLLPSSGRVSLSAAERVARLTVQSLTILAVRDKMLRDSSFANVIAYVQEHYPDHLKVDSQDLNDLETVAGDIGEGVDFAGLDPSMLGDVYENAILEPAKRSELGAFYTPPSLGHRILRNLPIEEVPPGNRTTIDPTCGSGTLLLAANERLQDAMVGVDDYDRHTHARKLLLGADKDAFAVEIARLAMLIGALPYGNGYRVEQADALAATALSERANLVVSNPPWRWERRAGYRDQSASRFLQALVSRCEPDGFFACVMPATWLTDETGRASREWLRQHADIFEVWRLPERVFRTAEQAACVVFGNVTVRQPVQKRFVYRHVSRGALSEFVRRGLTDIAIVADDPGGDAPLIADVLADFDELTDKSSLREVASVRNGVPVTNIESVEDQHGRHRLLRGYGLVDEFGEVAPGVLTPVDYPTGFWRSPSDTPDVYLTPKVLVSATRRVDNPWRLKAFEDPLGVIPRNSMHVVIPHQNDSMTRKALLAVLASSIASVWADVRSTSRNVNDDTVAGIPVPRADSWPRLAAAVDAVRGADGARRQPAILALEHVVWDAFGLTPEHRSTLQRLLADVRAPEGEPRFYSEAAAPSRSKDERSSLNVATVLAVDSGKLLVHVPGVTSQDGSWVNVPSSLPGWAARAGMSLDVLNAHRGLDHAEFRLQPQAWRTLDDVLDTLKVEAH